MSWLRGIFVIIVAASFIEGGVVPMNIATLRKR